MAAIRQGSFARYALALAAIVAIACAKPIPIPLEGTSQSFGRISGQWTGEYTGTESGRSGSIQFKLDAAAELATGDVMMRPRALAQNGMPTSGPEIYRPVPTFLTISLVRAEGGRIIGTLDPYEDPEYNCIVQTSFNGQLVSANRIEGTFVTYGPGLPRPQRGTWWVIRDH